jgi:hypothetical protein
MATSARSAHLPATPSRGAIFSFSSVGHWVAKACFWDWFSWQTIVGCPTPPPRENCFFDLLIWASRSLRSFPAHFVLVCSALSHPFLFPFLSFWQVRRAGVLVSTLLACVSGFDGSSSCLKKGAPQVAPNLLSSNLIVPSSAHTLTNHRDRPKTNGRVWHRVVEMPNMVIRF